MVTSLGQYALGLGLKVSGMACDSSTCSSVVMLVAVLLECSMVGCMEEGGIEAVRGTRGDGCLISQLHAGEVYL